jgi:hypothetical protein
MNYMSQRTELKLALGVISTVVLVSAVLVLQGQDWALGLVAVAWPTFMVWAYRSKCERCDTHHLHEISGVSAHPVWPIRQCRTCGLSLDLTNVEAAGKPR